jgi:hypothetical protein
MTIPMDVDAYSLLAAEWHDLRPDEYVDGSPDYRHRRFGRFLSVPGDDGRSASLTLLPHRPFVQSADVIPLYAGRPRSFAPLTRRAAHSAPLGQLIVTDLELVQTVGGGADPWTIAVHMIRVHAERGASSAPAPEGRHRDGHSFVVMHMVSRRRCHGGESRLYHPGRETPVFRHTLRAPLETLVVDDVRLEHEVTSVCAESDVGIRDMLIVDFDRQ